MAERNGEDGARSGEAVAEDPSGEGEGEGADEGEGPEVGDEAVEGGAFEVDAVGDVDGVAERVDEGGGLEGVGHAADRRGEAGEKRERHHEHERVEHRLLHGGGDGGDEQAHADGGEEEPAAPEVERGEGAHEGDAEPELCVPNTPASA